MPQRFTRFNVRLPYLTSAFCMLVVMLLFTNQAARAQTDTLSDEALMELSLEELMNIPVEIASMKSQQQEEAPSIVSVITQQDIQTYGAQDISDVLRMVPGFELGIDVFSIIGLGFRGIWVHEGKALIMVDGVLMNDFGYGNFNFIGSLPLAMVEKIEIIRGPGSALYGGFAEITAINIITQKGKSLNGMKFNSAIGSLGNKGVVRNGNVSVGGVMNDLEVSTHIGYGVNPLSSRPYDDFFGNRLQLGEANSGRTWKHLITQAKYKNLKASFNHTSFDFLSQDGLLTVIPQRNGNNTELNNHLKQTITFSYEANLSAKFKLTPTIEYSRGNFIATSVLPTNSGGIYGFVNGVRLERYRGELIGTYTINNQHDITFGGGYIRDEAYNKSSIETPGLYGSVDPSDTVYNNYADSKFGVVQYLAKFGSLGLTAGARYESTTFGDAFAPRIGLTFVKNKFNTKLLYGRAFRIPMPWQAYTRFLAYAENLGPEISNTIEFEAGYKISKNILAKANTFFIDIDKPITFIGSTNSYQNFGKIQSLGVEAELQFHFPTVGGFFNLAYAAPGKKTSDVFVTADTKNFLALPPLKMNLGGYVKVKSLTVAPSFTYLSQRYGQSANFANGLTDGFENTLYQALILTNINLSYQQVLKGFDINVSAHNLFDSEYVLLQPYYGGHAPLPAFDRQLMVGLVYKY